MNLFDVLVPRVKLNISKVDLKPILKNRCADDILNELHSTVNVRKSMLFNLVKLDYSPILRVLQLYGVKFNKISEG